VINWSITSGQVCHFQHTSAILQSVGIAYFVTDFDSGGSAHGRRRNTNSSTCYYRTAILMSNCGSEGVDCDMCVIDINFLF
jgi:hypothetical protein